MELLVAGADRVDAGKTTFSVGLVERTDALGYKPRAGNDYWHDHDDYERATTDGRLYGKDAKRLVEASSVGVASRSAGDEPEAINPVHRLWHPAPGGGTGVLGREDRSFLVDRVGDRFVVNGSVSLPNELADRLPLEDAVRVTTLEELNDAMASLHVPALESLSETIASTRRAVVESYSDVARPLSGLSPDAVAVVEPTRCRIYAGDRYAKACEVATGGPGTGRLEQRVGPVVDLLEPADVVRLPALGAAARRDPEAIASAYEPAYDSLIATASASETR